MSSQIYQATGATSDKHPCLKRGVMFCLLACAMLGVAQAQQPPAKPELRIETGMHTAIIRRIAIDRDNRYLVTSSEDKTARVWELPSGRLLRVLRPPLGDGNEGKLYSVAMSPDGRVVAVGGWTGYNWDEQHSIYIFDRESGRILHRIAGLPNVINHLIYSHDGTRLAASLWGENGVRVYETGGYSQIFSDPKYAGSSFSADFDPSGRLATACYDGFLRLYEPTVGNRVMRLVAKQKVEGGNQPFSAIFSPDGSKIAVGFDDSTRVAVVSGRDLSRLFAPNMDSVDSENLISMAWSADGKTLFAGGTYAKDGQRVIRYWTEGGRGKWREVPASPDTVTHILPTRDGGVVFGSGDPAFGRIDASGNRTLFLTAAIADYRDNHEGFLLSNDGTRFQFGYEAFGKSPARFSLGDRQLLTDTQSSETRGLKPPATSGLPITDWKYTYAPKLNGKPLKLSQYEISRSLAISPDRSRFLLGTDFRLRLYEHIGKEIWQVATPETTWSVNISGDGRVAVAAYGDGTIRWYRMTDGKELLAFFPHADRKRWVLWTPSGYYDSSAGAEDLIGWHVNNGKDASADFYPASRFRSTAYRPDVVGLVLTTLDESTAVARADEALGRKQQLDIARSLPPVVELVSPADTVRVTRPALTLRYRVRSQSSAEITGTKILIDGRPAGAGKGQSSRPPVAGTIIETEVTLPERDCDISIIAENAYAASAPATIRVTWAGGTPSILKPTLYLLAIGVNDDREPDTEKLFFAEKDARDFASAMKAQEGGIYRQVSMRVLTDTSATKEQILEGFDWLIRETTSRDVAMIFISGHGLNDRNRYFFMTSNAERAKLLATAVSFSDIKSMVETVPGKVVFFLDTCHSGNALGGAKGPFDLDRVINELASAENGAVVFASSTGRQRSFERGEWQNGAFTKALVEGLNGRADLLDNNRISIGTLDVWLTKRVKELTGNTQSPVLLKPGSVPDFPIAIKK